MALLPAGASEPVVPGPPKIEYIGGSGDDRLFATAALGLRPGEILDEARLASGLKAIRLTDRFRDVCGRLEGQNLRIELEPWPELRDIVVSGALPIPVKKDLLPGLRKGMRVGEARLAQFCKAAELRLRESGYPKAVVQAHREAQGARLRFELIPGEPEVARSLVFKGEAAPYSAERLLGLVKVEAGKTLWTETFRRAALARIRQRFLKDKRYQGQAELELGPGGEVVLTAHPGPVVRIESTGEGLGWKRLRDLVPLARSERYSPELLEAGARAIVRFLRGKGYLDAEVAHRTEVLKGSAKRPEELRVTYVLNAGERLAVGGVRFERNLELPSEELAEAADLPSSRLGLWTPRWTGDLISAVEERVKQHYRTKGFADVGVRRLPLEVKDGKGTLALQVREGVARKIQSVQLDLPIDPAFDAWYLAEALTSLFAEQPTLVGLEGENLRRYRTERPRLGGLVGTLEKVAAPEKPGVRRFRFRLERPIPLLKHDLAQMLNVLRQRLGNLGSLRPVYKLDLDGAAEGMQVAVEIPPQSLTSIRRLVVQGSDVTRARAILRESRLEAGRPLDTDRLSRAQAQVGGLAGLEQVDLLPLGEADEGGGWKEGDLFMRVAERSRWVVSSGFGYDKSQGYHLDLGAQRLNVGGMGRTVDFGLRAGDATLRNPTLRKWFPTGEFTRSVDMYRIGYQDPWFTPSWLGGWLPDRTLFNAEAAYIEEQRSAYMLRRRRALAGFEWTFQPGLVVQAGYRFERTEVRAVEGAGILDNELALVARIPGRSIISAPYFQVVRDRRDNRLDPTGGSFSSAHFEFANQTFGTSPNSSFVKLDLRQQWNWPLGYRADGGVVSLGVRVGMARPTASSAEELPLSERFFAGGPGTHRGVEPDSLGVIGQVPLRSGPPGFTQLLDAHGLPRFQSVPLGGQGLVLANLEYRFPTWWSMVWGEVFVDSGQVYQSFRDTGQAARFPPLRTALGVGLILKLGLPIKLEYAADVKRILGRPRTQLEKDTQLKSLLVSAGFQF